MIRSRRLIVAFAAIAVLIGIYLLRSAPVDVLPEFQAPSVDVQTEALGLSAEETEQLITVPLEQSLLKGVAWLDTMQSQSVPGLSSIHLTFKRGTDLFVARQLVQEQVQAADLTTVSRAPQILQPTSSSGRVMMIGLSSKTMSLMQMSVLARWTIVPKLTGVPGVANVATWGQRDQQLQVLVDPQTLKDKNVTLDDIITSTGNALWYSPLTYLEASTPGAGGFMDTSNQRLTVMHLFPISTPEQLAQVVLDVSPSGTTTTTTAPAGSSSGGTTAGTGGTTTTGTSVPADGVGELNTPVLAAGNLATVAATTKSTSSSKTSTKSSTTSSSTSSTESSTTSSTTSTTVAPLRLGDVATVVQDSQPLIGDAALSSGPGLLLVIDKSPGADVRQVTKGIEDAMRALQPGMTGVTVDYNVFRPETYIDSGLGNVEAGLAIGGVLLLIMLAAFLFSWRQVLTGAMTLALALVVTELLLRAMGYTFNWLTIAGTVLGLAASVDVVASAIGSIQNGATGDDGADGADGAATPAPEGRAAQIIGTARAIRTDAIYSVLVALAALLPVFSITGSAGPIVRALALPFALTIAAATAASLVVTPALALMLTAKRPAREAPFVRWLKRPYERAVAWMMRVPAPAYVFAGIFVVAAIGLLPFLGTDLVPTLKDTGAMVEFNAQAGTSLTEMSRVVDRAENELKAIPGVKGVGGEIGRAVLGDQIVNVDSSTLWLNLDGTKNYQTTMDAIQNVVSGYPGIDADVVTYPGAQLSAAAPGEKNELTVRLYGEDFDVLRSKAAAIGAMAKTVKGVTAADVQTVEDEPGVDIEVNLAAAERYGIKPGDVRREAAALLSGLTVGSLYEQDKVFDVVVWGTAAVRTDLDTVRNLLLDTPSGRTVKLSDVASVSIGPNPAVVLHDQASRMIDIHVNVSGRSAGDVADDIEGGLSKISLPLEYHAELLSSSERTESMELWIIVLGVAAFIAILLLLQSALDGWLLSLMVVLGSIAAVAGGVVVAFFMDGTISPAVLLALLVIFGIAARYAIFLVRDCREPEGEPGSEEEAGSTTRFSVQAVAAAAGRRLGPTLLTVFGVGFLMAPLALLRDTAGLEVLRVPVMATLGGLVSLAFVMLFVMPALCRSFARRRNDATI